MPIVALDIGHGSNTYNRTGGKGVVRNGRVYEEHTANSDLAMRTKKILERHGVEVWLPQPPNCPEVSLIERTNAANRRGVDLYWSDHFNAGISSASGVCAFYWYTADESRKLAEQFAVNAAKAGIKTHGDGTHASKPDSWTNLHVCRETAMTAVLTENGFMTNDRDFELIFGSKKEKYRQKVAEVHAKTILGFFNIDYVPVFESAQEEEIDMKELEALKNRIAELEENVQYAPTHQDVSKWAKEAWEWFDNHYSDGRRPQSFVTREELAVIEHRIFAKNADVLHDWAKESWEEAVKKEITDGSTPGAYVKKEAVVTLIDRAFESFVKEQQKQLRAKGCEQ